VFEVVFLLYKTVNLKKDVCEKKTHIKLSYNIIVCCDSI
jgi:hypothetical protein